MKKYRRLQRILILSLLSLTVFAPILLVSERFKTLSTIARKEFIEDLASISYRTDGLRLSAIEQVAAEELKEPKLVVLKQKDFNSVVSHSSDKNHDSDQSGNAQHSSKLLQAKVSETNYKGKDSHRSQKNVIQMNSRGKDVIQMNSRGKKRSNQYKVGHDQNLQDQSRREMDEKVRQMRDDLVQAKAYLNFAPPTSKSHVMKELRTRIKDLERAAGDARKDSDLSRSALQRIRSMEGSLAKASHIYPDCSSMATKLRAMAHNAEEQVRTKMNEESFLTQVAGRTTPKGLHCLSMRLTAEYFFLQPEERLFPNQQNLHNPELYHYAVFSDNVLACAVVVNSTIASAKEPGKIVFHVVTDSLNFPAISMWFLSNPLGTATISIQSVENFDWLSKKYNTTLKEQKSSDPRYTSPLNHLRFYLPDIFPALNKIVLFDHDVVVQRDLSGLWSLDMKGKVNAAVETCHEGEASFRRMHKFMNFSDPFLAKRFNAKMCTWAFGMNLFDLREWRRKKLTTLYRNYLRLGLKKPLWKAGSLPLGWITFYNQTVAMDKSWHVLGLGHDSGLELSDIERAAVIHYDGVKKPWLEIGIANYKGYWGKHVQYDHPYLKECNIHE